MNQKNEEILVSSRRPGKEVLTDKMIVEEVRKGDNYVVWKSPKTTVHIIPDAKLEALLTTEKEEAVKAERERCIEIASFAVQRVLSETYKEATRLYERARMNPREYSKIDAIAENARQVCCSRLEPKMKKAIYEALTPTNTTEK